MCFIKFLKCVYFAAKDWEFYCTPVMAWWIYRLWSKLAVDESWGMEKERDKLGCYFLFSRWRFRCLETYLGMQQWLLFYRDLRQHYRKKTSWIDSNFVVSVMLQLKNASSGKNGVGITRAFSFLNSIVFTWVVWLCIYETESFIIPNPVLSLPSKMPTMSYILTRAQLYWLRKCWISLKFFA